MGLARPPMSGLGEANRLLHCGISAPSAEGFMAEMGHKHRISVLLSQPLCRKCLQYLPSFVHCSEASQVPGADSTSGAKDPRGGWNLLVGWCLKTTSGRAP
jgi:hypothetical protein